MWRRHWDSPEVWNPDLSRGEPEAPRRKHMDEEAEGISEGVLVGYFNPLAEVFGYLLFADTDSLLLL